jgi:hypothetical protein
MVSEHDGIRYINSGTWTDFAPCPYVVVEGDDVRLEYWPPEDAAAEQNTVDHTAAGAPAAETHESVRASGS